MTEQVDGRPTEALPPESPKWKPWHKKVLIGCAAGFVFLIGVSMCSAPSDKKDTKPAEVVETSVEAAPAPEPSPEPETPAAPALTDEDIAARAEVYIKENWGMSPDASWISFECTPGITCWQPYVTGFTFQHGILRPTLQIDRSSQKYLGEKASENMAGFIGHADEDWAKEISWVEVVDGAGVHVAQKSVKR